MKNSKVVILVSCLFGATLTAPLVRAASHSGGFSGGHSLAGRPGMGMPGRPGMSMRSDGNRHGGDFHHHHDHFDHHEDEDNDVIFIGSFGFPSWWGWGWVLGGAGAIRTDIMVIVTRTDTVMAMDMATTAMATAADPEWRSYSAGSLAPVIIADRLTAS
jgi:hypothetical protein